MRLSVMAANLAADAVCTALDRGLLRVYAGDPLPTPDTPVTSQILLAELSFGCSAFSAAAGGVARAVALTDEDDALASGTATFCLALTDEEVPVFLAGVGPADSGADCELDEVEITEHGAVQVARLLYRQPRE